MMSPVPTPWNSTAKGTRAPRTMGMDLRVSCAKGNPLRAAITSPERSKWRFAKLTYTGTARSFPISPPFQLRSRTVTSSLRRSANLRWRLALRRQRSTATPRTARSSPGRSVINARKKSIQPLCDTQERLVCTYEPEETCNDVDKQYCHKVEKVVLEEECDMKFDTRYL